MTNMRFEKKKLKNKDLEKPTIQIFIDDRYSGDGNWVRWKTKYKFPFPNLHPNFLEVGGGGKKGEAHTCSGLASSIYLNLSTKYMSFLVYLCI